MRASRFALGLSLALLAVLAVCGKAEEKAAPKGKPQTVCPITGKPIDKNVYVDHEGKRVYFCCPACPETFRKDPARYIKQMEDQGIALEKRQTLCPVMEAKINNRVYADYKGKRVYFCCADCQKEFAKDPEKYIRKLEDQGVTLDETPKPSKEEPEKGK